MSPESHIRISIARRLISGVSWAASGKILAAVMGLLLNTLLARVLSPEELGAYFLIFSITLFGVLLAGLGIPQTIVRVIAGSLDREESYTLRRSLRHAFLWTSAGAVIIGGVYALAAGQWASQIFDSNVLAVTAFLVGMLIAARTFQSLLSQIYRGFHDIRAAVLLEGIVSNTLLIAALVIIWLVYGKTDLATVLEISILCISLVVVAALFLLRRYVTPLPVPDSVHDDSRLLGKSLPLLVSGLALFAVNEGHIWILGAFRSEEEVAVFGAAIRTAKLLAIPLLVINSVIPPMIAQLYAEKRFRKVEQVLQTTAAFAGILAVVLLVVLGTSAEAFLGLLFGDYYAQGANIFLILLAAQTVNVLSGSPGVLLTMAGKQSVLMKFSLTSGLFGVITSLALVKKYGAGGVAVGLSVGMLLHNIGMWAYCRQAMGIRSHFSFAAFIDLWYRMRRRLSDRAQDGRPLWRFLEDLVCIYEDVVWGLRGKRIIECLGDSHTHIFRHINGKAICPELRFRVTAVRGATAFGLGNPNSRTNAYQIFADRLSRMRRKYVVLFMLGEVDVGFLVWLKAQQSGRRPEQVMEEALERYFAFLEKHLADIGALIIASAPLPTIPDEGQVGEVAKARAEVKATQRERTRLTLRYNARLRDWAQRHGAYYLDLDQPALDPETGLVRETLLRENRSDHHYAPDEFAKIICSRLQMPTFRAWLSAH